MTDPVVARCGLMPAMPAIRKYVCVKSKYGDSTKAEIVDAALISRILSDNGFEYVAISGLTSFTSSQLTDVAFFCAMGIGEKGRKACHSDVVS